MKKKKKRDLRKEAEKKLQKKGCPKEILQKLHDAYLETINAMLASGEIVELKGIGRAKGKKFTLLRGPANRRKKLNA